MSASATYIFKLFLLSRKQLRKLVGLLRQFQNVLPKSSKLDMRPRHGPGHIIYDQA